MKNRQELAYIYDYFGYAVIHLKGAKDKRTKVELYFVKDENGLCNRLTMEGYQWRFKNGYAYMSGLVAISFLKGIVDLIRIKRCQVKKIIELYGMDQNPKNKSRKIVLRDAIHKDNKRTDPVLDYLKRHNADFF
ncbi:MAG TPA: hypothetical protein VL443_24075 [Cyclobacteriaceae bacterium]|jgi:hypothetical protein|nr:hypothetical protein [Cyclobacteriaceae bacterium]